MFQRRRERGGRFKGIWRPKEGNSSTCFGRTETRKSQAITRQKPPPVEAVLDARETVPPGNDGGGGANRTQVWSAAAAGPEGTLRRPGPSRDPRISHQGNAPVALRSCGLPRQYVIPPARIPRPRCHRGPSPAHLRTIPPSGTWSSPSPRCRRGPIRTSPDLPQVEAPTI